MIKFVKIACIKIMDIHTHIYIFKGIAYTESKENMP